MASHALINTKPTILGATLGAIPGIAANPPERFSFAPCILGAFFHELGWSPHTRFRGFASKWRQNLASHGKNPAGVRQSGLPGSLVCVPLALMVGWWRISALPQQASAPPHTLRPTEAIPVQHSFPPRPIGPIPPAPLSPPPHAPAAEQKQNLAKRARTQSKVERGELINCPRSILTPEYLGNNERHT